MNIVIKLAKEYQIPYIRLVNEPIYFGTSKLFRNIQLLFLKFLSELAGHKIKKAGLKHNDYFIGFTNAMKLSRQDIEHADELAEKYPNKIIELCCHPGYEDESLRKTYGRWDDHGWENELKVLAQLP